MRKNINCLKVIMVIAVLTFPAIMSAVTQKEMEQARTIAAKAYIRYANDGSGYLDDLNPTTMEELEAVLKTKEKENIKAFKAIPMPTDYKDWDKAKLVEYWAVTAFQNKGLLEKGRGGRIRARTQINKMTIAPPQPEKTVAPTTPTVAQDVKGESPAVASPQENPSQELKQLEEAEKALAAREEEEETDMPVEKESNYTWVYIMVLAILVAIVVALVVYAANVMKKNGTDNQTYGKRDEGDAERIEHLETAVADKDVEIAMLNKKLENAQRQNSDLKSKLEAATAELQSLKAGAASRERMESRPSEPVGEGKAPLRSIYLGRANSKGIFVRADRSLNVGNSVFVLETSDGYSGTFRVANSQAAWSLALSNPREYLENACSGHNLDDTASASKILTESAGTAVFEGGCWRVIRKAKIRYV